jgi:hypothetical protein
MNKLKFNILIKNLNYNNQTYCSQTKKVKLTKKINSKPIINKETKIIIKIFNL